MGLGPEMLGIFKPLAVVFIAPRPVARVAAVEPEGGPTVTQAALVALLHLVVPHS